MKNLIKKNQLMITALAIMIAVAGYLQFAGTNLKEEEYLPTANQSDVLNGISGEDLGNTGVNSDYNIAGLTDLSEEDLATAGLTDINSLDSDVNVEMQDYLEDGMETASNDVNTQGAVSTAAGASSGTDALTPADGEVPGEAVFTSGANVANLSEAKLMKEQVRAKNKETLLDIINNTALSDDQKQGAVDNMVQMTAVAEKEMAAELLLEAKGFNDVVVSITEGSVDVVVNAPELTDAQRAQIEDIVKRKTDVSAANIIISTVVQQ